MPKKIMRGGTFEEDLNLVQNDGLSLANLSEQLRGNEEIVMAAVTQNGLALQFASEELRNNKEIVMAAVSNNWDAVEFASEELQDDEDVMDASIMNMEVDENEAREGIAEYSNVPRNRVDGDDGAVSDDTTLTTDNVNRQLFGDDYDDDHDDNTLTTDNVNRRLFGDDDYDDHDDNENVNVENDGPPIHEGIAYEVHNFFANINIAEYERLITTNNEKNYLQMGNIVDYMHQQMDGHVDDLASNKLFDILSKLYLSYSQLSEHDIILIGKTTDFVLAQPQNFIDFYINAFIEDCYHAYEGEAGTGISCTKGILERIVLTTGDAAYAVCSDNCTNDTYIGIMNVLGKNKIDINELMQQWATQYIESPELLGMTHDERKTHFINYLNDKYRLANMLTDETRQHIIDRANQVDYVFDTLSFGGQSTKRKNTKRKTQNAKHKTQNTKRKTKNKKRKTKNMKQKMKNIKHKTQKLKHRSKK